MTNPTPHGQVPEALIDLIDAYAETRHRCGGIYNARTEAARKAVIEALSGVQALSAAPAEADSAPEDAALWFAERDNVLHSFWVLLGEAEVHADNDNNPLLKHQVEEFYRQWNALNGTTLGPRWVSRAARKQGANHD